MVRIWDREEARGSLLRRLPLEEYPLPQGVLVRLREVFDQELSPAQAVARIIAQVKARGDAALLELTRHLDGVELPSLEVSLEERERALGQIPAPMLEALKLAAERIWDFHRVRVPTSSFESPQQLSSILRPLQRVGIYVPGGTASYPSTVLMTAIPARVAGVGEIVLTTPPRQGGEIPLSVLAAAQIAAVNRVFRVGGAQAIAALALGTSSIPRVDKVCGPGNIFVQLAKKQVYGLVDIDGIYGPTELVVLADDSASPSLCAAELLAQAEHDILASAILITPSPKLAQAVSQEVRKQLEEQGRKDVISQALESRGGIVLVNSLEEAVELINDYAPEHLLLMMEGAWAWVDKLRHAGSISINCSVSLADYMAGPSHVLPTAGTARFRSPLGVGDFLRTTNIVALGRDSLEKLGPPALTLARNEGLEAHARSLEMWMGP